MAPLRLYDCVTTPAVTVTTPAVSVTTPAATVTTPAVPVSTPTVSVSPTVDQDDGNTANKAIPGEIVAPIVVIAVAITIIAVATGIIIRRLLLFS